MLQPDETGRRIRAARELRGVSQDELAKRLAGDGLGRWDAGRIERGTLPMRRVHVDALARNLDVPAAWFTLEDVSVLWTPREGEGALTVVERLDALTDEIELLRAAMATRDVEALARFEAVLGAIPGVIRGELRR